MTSECPPMLPIPAVTLAPGELDGCNKFDIEADRLEGQADWRTGPDEFEVRLDSGGRAHVTASSRSALNRARTVVASQPPVPSSQVMTLRDSGRIAQRAVLECFYGARWAPEDRAHVVAQTAALGANTYVYGPSADRRTGGLWRLLYEGAEREQLGALAADANGHGMTPIWRVSPAAPLEVSKAIGMTDSAELRSLIEKVEDTLAMGFGKVLIAFDDITAGLDAVSAQSFPGSRHPLAQAQATIINAVVREVGAEKVLACPTHYWGTEPSSYRYVFGSTLHPDVAVCWTGPSVISDSISADAARRVAEDLGHPLWLWDNYPVNDWDMTGIAAQPLQSWEGLDNLVQPRRAPLAPLTDRDPGLADVVVGYGSNMALGAHMGLPAAQTAMDFAWLGQAYDSAASWDLAAARTGSQPAALRAFAQAAGPISGNTTNAPSSFARACAQVLAAEDPSDPDVLAVLDREIEKQISTLGELRSTPTPLMRELQPWLMELGRQSVMAQLASTGLRGDPAEKAGLPTELSSVLLQPSTVSMGSGMGRALAEYVRGLLAGGTPELVFTEGVEERA